MIMNIAIFLKNLNFEMFDNSIVEAFIFKVEDDGLITGLGNEILCIKNLKFLLSWLVDKHVKILYLEGITENFKINVEKTGVKVKHINELKHHPLLKSFLFADL